LTRQCFERKFLAVMKRVVMAVAGVLALVGCAGPHPIPVVHPVPLMPTRVTIAASPVRTSPPAIVEPLAYLSPEGK
jgi:hypothetical protein